MYCTKFRKPYELVYLIHIFIDVYKLTITKAKKIHRFKFANEETLDGIM